MGKEEWNRIDYKGDRKCEPLVPTQEGDAKTPVLLRQVATPGYPMPSVDSEILNPLLLVW